MAFTPNHAPLVILTFLATALLGGVLLLAAAAALGARRFPTFKMIAGAVVAVPMIYAGLVLLFSARSEEQLLRAGQTKYFCEMDCHVAYSVTGVTTAKTLGEGERAVTAKGVFWVVTVKSWFDPKTTSVSRPKDFLLYPNPREVYAFDEIGNRYSTSLAGQKAASGSTVPFTQPLVPGDSYETTLVFDLPKETRNPRLLVADMLPLTALLIGHENSFGHKKAYFSLEPAPISSSVR